MRCVYKFLGIIFDFFNYFFFFFLSFFHTPFSLFLFFNSVHFFFSIIPPNPSNGQYMRIQYYPVLPVHVCVLVLCVYKFIYPFWLQCVEVSFYIDTHRFALQLLQITSPHLNHFFSLFLSGSVDYRAYTYVLHAKYTEPYTQSRYITCTVWSVDG